MRLTTKRLVLRELRLPDWRATQEYERDPEVMRWQSFEPFTPEQSRAYIRRARAHAQARPRRTFDLAVVLRSEGRLIGRCGIHLGNPEIGEAVLWYILARSFWGQGYITEAARALVDFGFAELGLHRVWADCDPRNLASVRVLEKLGLRLEGHLRENVFLKGEWCDSLVFAVLDHEWRAEVRGARRPG